MNPTCPPVGSGVGNSTARRGGRAAAALAGLLAGLMLLGGRGAAAREPIPGPRKTRLNVLYAKSLLSGVNQNDALAALKVWILTIGRNRGFELDTQVNSFDSLAEAEKRIQQNAVDLLVFDAAQYLSLARTDKIDPEFLSGGQQGQSQGDYVIVARREQNPATLGTLRGKRILLHRIGSPWGQLWLEAMLGEAALGPVNDYFASRDEFGKPAAVVLPVFFGKCDAAVVKRSSLVTMAELNPQLASRLQVITNSPSLPELVVCVHKEFKVFHDDLVQGLAELHTDLKGQQVLLLFKIDKLERFQPGQLEAARQLLARQPPAPAAPARAEAAGTMKGNPGS